jgi:hypothetical protein
LQCRKSPQFPHCPEDLQPLIAQSVKANCSKGVYIGKFPSRFHFWEKYGQGNKKRWKWDGKGYKLRKRKTKSMRLNSILKKKN